jgi:hypothetical protein
MPHVQRELRQQSLYIAAFAIAATEDLDSITVPHVMKPRTATLRIADAGCIEELAKSLPNGGSGIGMPPDTTVAIAAVAK